MNPFRFGKLVTNYSEKPEGYDSWLANQTFFYSEWEIYIYALENVN